jgi:hypothetical protein
MNEKNILFQIPIYQERSSAFYDGLRVAREEAIQQQAKRIMNVGLVVKEENELYQDLLQDISLNPKMLAWNYNRIIGWVEFYVDGSIIKAGLWFVRVKRVNKHLQNKIFDNLGKIADVAMAYDMQNDEIRQAIAVFLANLQGGKYTFKFLLRHYIDSSLFLRNLEFTDVRSLIEHIIQ